jgi:hypothetical protein
MQYGLDLRAQEAQDAFWWIVLQELRAHAHVTEVSMEVEERTSVDPFDRLERVRVTHPSIRFAVEGFLIDLVRPLPSAVSSLEEIHRTLDSWMEPRASSAGTPSTSTPTPPPPEPLQGPAQAQVPMDDTSVMFSLLELD